MKRAFFVAALIMISLTSAGNQLYLKPFFGSVVTTGAVGGGGSSCTYGVDCYCDTVSDPLMVHCEDNENPSYYLNTAQSWIANGAGEICFRGGGSAWKAKYGAAASSYWQSGQPASPRLGCTCNARGLPCEVKEYCSTQQGNLVDGLGRDCWDGNNNSTIDVQRAGDVNDEVSSLTLDAKWKGNQYLAERIGPSPQYGGRYGSVTFSATGEIGFTGLFAFSSNIGPGMVETGGWSSGGDFLTMPWKFDEWGPDGMTLFMGNTGGNLARSPFSSQIPWSSEANCNAMIAAAPPTIGSAFCSSGTSGFFQVRGNFIRHTDWEFGKWGCVKGYVKGLNTSNGELHIWFAAPGVASEVEIFSMTGVNFALGVKSTSQLIDRYEPNTYYNGNAGDTGPGDSYYGTSEAMYRYRDNTHIRKGFPVSCAAIGWAG